MKIIASRAKDPHTGQGGIHWIEFARQGYSNRGTTKRPKDSTWTPLSEKVPALEAIAVVNKPVALKATIFKAELRIADMERGYYHDHTLTVARHPSETDERMMVRLLAFALNADETLAFGAGLSTDDEPDLWRKDLTGSIDIWIDVGLPDEKRIRKACGRAGQVLIYSYGGRAAERWWQQVGDKLARSNRLTVINLPQAGTQALAGLAARNMQLQYTIQDSQVWVANDRDSVQLDPQTILASKPAWR